MITKLNLASRPFRNRTLPYLIALFIMAFAAAGAVLSFAQLRYLDAQSELAQRQIQEIERELQELRGKGELVQQQLTPDQQALLVGAHKIVANKSFGWSRLFADLEGVMPGSVSASRIRVENIFKDGDRVKAELNFSVVSRDYQSVMDMIDRMNNSGVFHAELRGQDRQKTERITYSQYTLRLIYTPRYGYSTASSSDVVRNEGGDQ